MTAEVGSPLEPGALRLATERLVLEPLGPDDVELTRVLLSDPEVTRYVMDPIDPADAPREHARCSRRGAGGRLGIWKLTERASGAFVGSGVLLPLPIDAEDTDWPSLVEDRYPDAEIEVGYLLRPAFWGRGFATEVCRRLLQFAFEMTTLTEVVAVTDPENVNSKRVLLKCGLRDEGERSAYATRCSAFRISRAEWESA